MKNASLSMFVSTYMIKLGNYMNIDPQNTYSMADFGRYTLITTYTIKVYRRTKIVAFYENLLQNAQQQSQIGRNS